jgi:hypothetical protein
MVRQADRRPVKRGRELEGGYTPRHDGKSAQRIDFKRVKKNP